MAVKFKSWCITFFLIPWMISLLFSSLVSAQTSLSCGQIKSDSLSATGEKDSFTFTPTVNDKIAVQVVPTSGESILTSSFMIAQGLRSVQISIPQVNM